MIIPGVSICQVGEARGHGLVVDQILLGQLANEIAHRGKVPVKLNHRGGLDTVIGWLENARIKAGKLLGDLELFKSGKDYNFVRELVEKFHGSIGLSPAFTGTAEPLRDGSQAARCSELHSIDLVQCPAANPTGLFEAEFNGALIQFEARPSLQRAKSTLTAKQVAEMRHLRQRIATLQLRFDAIQPRQRFVDDDEQAQGHGGGTNVGHDIATGALEGAGSAVLVDGLLHGSGTIAERLTAVARSLKNPIQSELPRKAILGGVAGGLLTAGAGLVVSQIAGRKRKEQQRGGVVGTLPATTQLAARLPLSSDERRDRSLYRVADFRHKVASDELNSAASSYIKSAATGGLAGGLVGSLRGKGKIGAGIGALAGIGSIAGIRAALPPDQFGQHSPEEHQIERTVPIAGAIVAAIAGRKKLKQAAGNLAEQISAATARRAAGRTL
ncbi:MAG: hypothetical protein QOH39_3030 [Verrucomicrobiota bacterium]|jgi:hypothetical protein